MRWCDSQSAAGEEEEGEEVVRELKWAKCPKVHEKVTLIKAWRDKLAEKLSTVVAFTANNFSAEGSVLVRS